MELLLNTTPAGHKSIELKPGTRIDNMTTDALEGIYKFNNEFFKANGYYDMGPNLMNSLCLTIARRRQVESGLRKGPVVRILAAIKVRVLGQKKEYFGN